MPLTGKPAAAEILTKLLTVDGPGSGLDADLVDGQEGLVTGSYSGTTAIQYTTDVWFDLFSSAEVGGTGVYLVKAGEVSTFNQGGGIFYETAVFLASLYQETNSTDVTSIPSTFGGHAPNARTMEFRLRRTLAADSKSYVQMCVHGESLTSATSIPWVAKKLF